MFCAARPPPPCLLQKPYLPLGSLQAQMLYPQCVDESYRSPESLKSILEQVQLGYLCDRSGGLGATRDWQDELSLGEQQVRIWPLSLLSLLSLLLVVVANKNKDGYYSYLLCEYMRVSREVVFCCTPTFSTPISPCHMCGFMKLNVTAQQSTYAVPFLCSLFTRL